MLDVSLWLMSMGSSEAHTKRYATFWPPAHWARAKSSSSSAVYRLVKVTQFSVTALMSVMFSATDSAAEPGESTAPAAWVRPISVARLGVPDEEA